MKRNSNIFVAPLENNSSIMKGYNFIIDEEEEEQKDEDEIG